MSIPVMFPETAFFYVMINIGREELFAFGIAHHRLEFAQQFEVERVTGAVGRSEGGPSSLLIP